MTVAGSGIYSQASDICAAAEHSGVVRTKETLFEILITSP